MNKKTNQSGTANDKRSTSPGDSQSPKAETELHTRLTTRQRLRKIYRELKKLREEAKASTKRRPQVVEAIRAAMHAVVLAAHAAAGKLSSEITCDDLTEVVRALREMRKMTEDQDEGGACAPVPMQPAGDPSSLAPKRLPETRPRPEPNPLKPLVRAVPTYEPPVESSLKGSAKVRPKPVSASAPIGGGKAKAKAKAADELER